jgi:hypothetical protein
MAGSENGSVAKAEAAGSTSIGALRFLSITCFGFGKACFKSQPFVSICWLFSVKS